MSNAQDSWPGDESFNKEATEDREPTLPVKSTDKTEDAPLFPHERLTMRDTFDARKTQEKKEEADQDPDISDADSSEEMTVLPPVRHATLQILKQPSSSARDPSKSSSSALPTLKEHLHTPSESNMAEKALQEELEVESDHKAS